MQNSLIFMGKGIAALLDNRASINAHMSEGGTSTPRILNKWRV